MVHWNVAPQFFRPPRWMDGAPTNAGAVAYLGSGGELRKALQIDTRPSPYHSQDGEAGTLHWRLAVIIGRAV